MWSFQDIGHQRVMSQSLRPLKPKNASIQSWWCHTHQRKHKAGCLSRCLPCGFSGYMNFWGQHTQRIFFSFSEWNYKGVSRALNTRKSLTTICHGGIKKFSLFLLRYQPASFFVQCRAPFFVTPRIINEIKASWTHFLDLDGQASCIKWAKNQR